MTTNFVNQRLVQNIPTGRAMPPVKNDDSVQEVTLADLKVDHSYQRTLKAHHKKIAKNFDKKAAGFLHVNIRPDYTQWNVDGQQRAAAMILCGFKTWLAHIHTLATVAEEAELFNKLNGGYGTRVGVGEGDLFKALIVAKDPNTLATIAAVERAGLKFKPKSRVLAWPYLGCTKACRRICYNYGPEMLERICRIMAASWPQCDDAMDGYLFLGVSMFLQTFAVLKDDTIITSFKRKPALTILQMARSRATSGNGIACEVRQALIETYNYNRRPQHRISMPTYGPKDESPENLPLPASEQSIAASI
jgi:hypothetical protein